MKILSIIIPTYNMDKYLDCCINTFIKSKYLNNLEVLIVNDGSKDNSLAIAKEFAQAYPQTIKVIDKENGGHGSTINVGVRQCRGKYFKVVDADDWVNTSEFDKLVEKLIDTDADCVICNFTCCFEADGKTKLQDMTNNFAQGVNFTINDYIKQNRLAMHSVTYKTETYRSADILLTEKCFYVDTQFIYYPLAVFETVVCYPFNVYQYRLQREGQSVSRESFLKHINDHRTVMFALCDFYNTFPSDRPEVKEFLGKAIGSHLDYQQSFLISKDLQKSEWREYKNFMKEIKKRSLPACRAMSIKRKIAMHLGVSGIRFLARMGKGGR